jgi:replicative DNA helicase
MEEIKSIIEKTARAKRVATNTTALDFGKIPPQSIDLEEAVLGAIMLEKDAYTKVIDILKPTVFYKPVHQTIFESIQRLFQKSAPIDILTVTQDLKEKGQLEIVGGPYYIASLTSRVGSAANIEFHCKILLEKHIKRELIRISGEVITDAFEESTDVFDVLDKAEQGLFDVSQGNLSRKNLKLNELIQEAITEMEKASKNESNGRGVPSGFNDLDRVTAGWQSSNLVIVAARPGMGKTAFALSMARNAAVDAKIPVAVFSLEMEAIELVNRLISGETNIDSDKIKKGKLSTDEWQALHANLNKLAEAPIFINDTPGLSITDFRAIARRLYQHHKIGLIVIDYLQLMRGTGESKGMREQEISMISRSLKAIAKELKIPIIALSQLSRKVEDRGGDRRPQLGDLRESGAIEQDADMVCFIYRPEYYGIEHDEEGNSFKGIAQIIIAKNRHGATRDVNLGFIGAQTKFVNLDKAQFGNNNFEEPGVDLDNMDGYKTKTMPSKNWDNTNVDEEAPF